MSATPYSWLNRRTAGALAHISTLPGDYGIGNLGACARHFVDVLARAGFRYWQICPLGPTGYGDSPYQTFSGQAGNPYFIDLGALQEEQLLEENELMPLIQLPRESVDYGELHHHFWPILRRASDRFFGEGRSGLNGMPSFAEFEAAHADWLPAFSQFMALKDHFGGRAWPEWPAEYREWTPDLDRSLGPTLQGKARQYSFFQYVFFGQWEALRRYARERGIGIIGDIPIFVALDSADTWQSRKAFRLDGQGQPLAVAGVPPDYFSAKGQLWGNPLYDWYYLRSTHYDWWIKRLRSAFALYDIIRLDHFRAFDTYWEIPAGAPDARRGRWRKGPGLDFFRAVKEALPEARIIAEDLGYIGPDVVALRRATGFPGMKILQFAYGHDANNVNLPHFYTPDSVAYTGTHDNLTTRGWLESLSPEAFPAIDHYFQLNGSRSAWPLIRAALATTSRLAIIPLPDLLDLGADATFNRPGTSTGNWRWRVTTEALDHFGASGAERIHRWIQLYDRTGAHSLKDYSEPPHSTAHPA